MQSTARADMIRPIVGTDLQPHAATKRNRWKVRDQFKGQKEKPKTP
jgi:hypothetical protein